MEYNPLNERLKKQYEDTLLHENYRDVRTADAVWKALNLFEKFTCKNDFISFNAEQAKAFKRWLIKQENSAGELLSISTTHSTLKNLRDFFGWLAIHPQYMRKIDRRAVAYLRFSNNQERAGRATRERPVPAIEEIRTTLQAMPYETTLQKRDRAIIAFMALTGVRDAALISLKMKDIDRTKREVWQDAKHVKTKNAKSLSTFFMAFDPLWEEIVIDWLDYAASVLCLQPNDPIFPKTQLDNNPETLLFVPSLSREHWANATPIREILKKAFSAANVPYYHPHSFRKMLVVWAVEHCTQMEFKAISQNISHEHAMTTYNAYGKLTDHKRQQVIRAIGTGNNDLSHVPKDVLLLELGKRMDQ